MVIPPSYFLNGRTCPPPPLSSSHGSVTPNPHPPLLLGGLGHLPHPPHFRLDWWIFSASPPHFLLLAPLPGLYDPSSFILELGFGSMDVLVGSVKGSLSVDGLSLSLISYRFWYVWFFSLLGCLLSCLADVFPFACGFHVYFICKVRRLAAWCRFWTWGSPHGFHRLDDGLDWVDSFLRPYSWRTYTIFVPSVLAFSLSDKQIKYDKKK